MASLTAIETDGPYPGYDCTSTEHEHHRDASDSIYRQTVLQGKFFSELRKREMFINQPDNYFFQGGSKSGEYQDILLTNGNHRLVYIFYYPLKTPLQLH